MASITSLPDVVIGVDTHKHTHTASIIDTTAGSVHEMSIPATVAGYERLADCVPAGSRVWAIEGTGCYGAGLARWLAACGETVVEVEAPGRPARRAGAKSDTIDARRAALQVLELGPAGTPKTGGIRQALAARLTARRSAVKAATDAQRQLLALVVTAPEPLRGRLHGLRTRALLAACLKLRTATNDDVEMRHTIRVLVRLARRIRDLEDEAVEHERALADLVAAWRPDLLDTFGVGPISAAVILTSWSHTGRIGNEARFARLAGVAPVPASSGLTVRHRLSRSGDRQLNRALHNVMLSRWRYHPETRAYVQRRRAEGKTTREIQRCLKRYIARQLHRQLEHHSKPLDSP